MESSRAYVALFRAVNVGGRARVSMADLRETTARLGLAQPRTVLQSGNLVFRAEPTATATLAARLEDASATDLALDTVVIVRSSEEWRRLIGDNPFPRMAATDPAHLLAMPLRAAPRAGAEASLRAAIVGSERVAIVGATAYLSYPDGIGRSKLTTKIIERHLGTVGTARNWTTAAKIAALLDA